MPILCVWLRECVNAQRKTKRAIIFTCAHHLTFTPTRFDICQLVLPTHSLTHARTQIADDFLVFVCYFIWFHFIFLKKEEAVTAAMVNVWCYLCWHGLVTAAQVMINENEMEGKNNTKSMMHLRCFKFGKHPFRNGKDEEEDHRHYQRELNQWKKCLKKGRSQNWVMECEMYTTNSFSIRMKYGRFSETNAL